MTNSEAKSAAKRHLVLVDAENMMLTGDPTTRDTGLLDGALHAYIPGFGMAQRVIACSHHAAPVVSFAFPGARHLWRSGPDGADLALLDVLENEHVGQRYGRITLCSGDGIFSEDVAHLGGADVDVTVIAREGHLARRLEMAARHVIKVPNAAWLFGAERAS